MKLNFLGALLNISLLEFPDFFGFLIILLSELLLFSLSQINFSDFAGD